MLDCLWTCEEEVQLKALMLMCEWWGIRNKVNAGESIKRVSEIIGNVERHLLDFSSLRPPKPPKPHDISIWEKPDEDFMKVNFDGAFHEASGNGGWGFIIHNHRVEFVAAGAGRLSHLRDPLHAETRPASA
ncbi:hypothetical protein QYE76_002679 [Lolium multiflorum]|uniref:RNase H type-1 domain-containing protein n=1 Tax=Lolium multiflorum TaxID=4521 RepID=A0AAD8RNP5_LOLMU|nr:hypothetical protein QYE76_002679 [Lolium multiflorum]